MSGTKAGIRQFSGNMNRFHFDETYIISQNEIEDNMNLLQTNHGKIMDAVIQYFTVSSKLLQTCYFGNQLQPMLETVNQDLNNMICNRMYELNQEFMDIMKGYLEETNQQDQLQ